MKTTTNAVRMIITLLFIIGLYSAVVSAQSTNPDSPTMLKQNTVQWKRTAPSKTTKVFYYAFTAGPGTVEITTDQRSVGITAMQNLSWKLTDTKFKELGSEDLYGVTTMERKVNEVTVNKKQTVILRVDVTEDVQEFKFRFDGAVSFAGGDEDVTEITGDTETESTQQICMPRNGIIIMTMQDGKKAKVDLRKVQKIEIQ
ncbi:hypothetical protein BH20ACI4_BH20ACI4_00990 [soil metagenome]